MVNLQHQLRNILVYHSLKDVLAKLIVPVRFDQFNGFFVYHGDGAILQFILFSMYSIFLKEDVI